MAVRPAGRAGWLLDGLPARLAIAPAGLGNAGSAPRDVDNPGPTRRASAPHSAAATTAVASCRDTSARASGHLGFAEPLEPGPRLG